MKIIILATLSCSLLSSCVFASEDMAMNKYKGFYIGAGIGTTEFNDYNTGEFIEYWITPSAKADGRSYKVITGYQFNRIVALEAQYTKYGNIKSKFELGDQKLEVKTKQNSFSLAANLGYTFDNGLRPFSIIGIGRVSDKHSSSIDELNFKDNSGSIRLGAGLDYKFNRISGLGMRAAYEADFYGEKIGSWYIGATYKF